jgi:hypothetical protein
MKDVLSIRHKDVTEDKINIIREKTGFPIEITLVDELERIIKKYGTKVKAMIMYFRSFKKIPQWNSVNISAKTFVR